MKIHKEVSVLQNVIGDFSLSKNRNWKQLALLHTMTKWPNVLIPRFSRFWCTKLYGHVKLFQIQTVYTRTLNPSAIAVSLRMYRASVSKCCTSSNVVALKFGTSSGQFCKK